MHAHTSCGPAAMPQNVQCKKCPPPRKRAQEDATTGSEGSLSSKCQALYINYQFIIDTSDNARRVSEPCREAIRAHGLRQSWSPEHTDHNHVSPKPLPKRPAPEGKVGDRFRPALCVVVQRHPMQTRAKVRMATTMPVNVIHCRANACLCHQPATSVRAICACWMHIFHTYIPTV